MLNNKANLPENEGDFFLEVKKALVICEEHLYNYSKENARPFLLEYVALWTEVHFMIVGQTLHDFDLTDSSLVLFQDKYMELNTMVDYDGLPLE